MRRAVVLGGTGLIGGACVRALVAEGFAVTGVARDASPGLRVEPAATWVGADVARLGAAGWARLVEGASVIVNAAGALQDGGGDDLAGVHVRAVEGLVAALAGTGARVVQVSAAGVAPDASTTFFRTKAQGDALLMASGLDWVILRPVLVLAPEAWGGTALLRGLAACPLVQPLAMPASRVQTVWVGDVAQAVVAAASGEVPAGTVADLAETEARSLPETARALRAWLGLPPWRGGLPVPDALLAAIGRGADLLGHLGWCSPLRTTALRTLAAGVRGDPAPWVAVGGTPCRPLAETLRQMPATPQERLFARMQLLVPVMVGALAAFWLLSGVIGLLRREAAEEVLTSRGVGPALATAAVVGGAAVDLALGLAVLVRRWATRACLGMAAVSATYLGGATLLAPGLWADPLGPLVKVVPALVLALATAAALERR